MDLQMDIDFTIWYFKIATLTVEQPIPKPFDVKLIVIP